MISRDDLEDAPEKLFECTLWCRELSREISGKCISSHATVQDDCDDHTIKSLTFHISTPAPEDMLKYLPEIRQIGTIARLTIHCASHEELLGEGMEVTVAIGKSGRVEITDCIRKMARDRVDPSQVNEALIDSYLAFKYMPDIVIKTGGDHLTDFLIWQSVYSELYFSDVNWKWFRKVDFLRILRDFQSRVRRFGR
jgi:undecaprenyl diphosphate synthase